MIRDSASASTLDMPTRSSARLGGGGNLLIGDLIDMQFLGSAYNPNLGSAISLVLMVIILICMGIMNQFDDGENVGGGMIL